MDLQTAIDQIKSSIKQQESEPIKIQGGSNISVSRANNQYIISSIQPEQETPLQYTIAICVNGVPKYLDILVAGNPYDIT